MNLVIPATERESPLPLKTSRLKKSGCFFVCSFNHLEFLFIYPRKKPFVGKYGNEKSMLNYFFYFRYDAIIKDLFHVLFMGTHSFGRLWLPL